MLLAVVSQLARNVAHVQVLLTALGKGVHEGISLVHIRVSELAMITADAAEEKVAFLLDLVS